MSKICSFPLSTLATHVVSGLQQFEETYDDEEGVNWEHSVNQKKASIAKANLVDE